MGTSKSVHTTLDLLVLTVLSRRGPLHGYAIASAIQTLSAEALKIDEGSLYPALHRMEEAGWITAESIVTENSRRARVYAMTRAGRSCGTRARQRGGEIARIERVTGAAGIDRNATGRRTYPFAIRQYATICAKLYHDLAATEGMPTFENRLSIGHARELFFIVQGRQANVCNCDGSLVRSVGLGGAAP